MEVQVFIYSLQCIKHLACMYNVYCIQLVPFLKYPLQTNNNARGRGRKY